MGDVVTMRRRRKWTGRRWTGRRWAGLKWTGPGDYRTPRPARGTASFAALVAVVFLGAFTAVFLWEGPRESEAAAGFFAQPHRPTPGQTLGPRRFTRCSYGSRAACVVDGDTIWVDGTKIRMADYNTPEVGNPGCTRERRLGERATGRLVALLNSGEVALLPNPQGRATDTYGRALKIVTVDGASVGDALVAEGLAHEWRGRRESWC